jgi:catechol 2,3-dioxygenase-like lactoylglutathione lyase family enzyme
VSSQLIFRVEDCAGLYKLLSERGASFIAPPHARDGETRAFFRDPDGHLFEISELT